MSTYIRNLVEIQKIDIEINRLSKEGEQFGKEFECEESDADVLGKQIEAIRKEIGELLNGKKEKEEKLRELGGMLEKDRKRLGEIKNDKQYKALTKEISNAEKAVKLLEMELAPLVEKIKKKNDELKDKEREFKGKTDAIKTKGGELEDKKQKTKKAIEERLEQRERLREGIAPLIFKKYETIKQKRGGIAIVSVKNETCQGCYIQIPPQFYIQLKKGSEELITCPHCHRILYFDRGNKASPDEALSQ